MNTKLTVLSLIGAILIAAGILATIQSRHFEASELPIYGNIPAFSLIDSTDAKFDRSLLDGKPWILNFFFTSCQGPCPDTSAAIARLERSLKSHDINFVSISVDPEKDSPEKLAEYAKRFNADLSRWHFLTGSRELIAQLISRDLKVGFEQELTTHSNKLILVDQRAQVRGFYLSSDRDSRLKLIQDLVSLQSAT